MRVRLGVGLCLAVLAGAAAPTGAGAVAAHPTAPAATAPTYTWPKIGHDPADTGVSADPSLSTADAGSLGVRWMASTGGTVLSSPVVAWDAALGETLVYQGNEDGYLTAYDAADGSVVWSTFLGSAVRDTPLVENGNVWVADTYAPALVKMNAATGAIECSTRLESTNNGSPTIGAGPGGAPTVYIAVNDLGTASGPLYAVSEATCAVDWTFTGYRKVTGSWDPLAYATDAHGTPLVVLGTADPDNAVYAVNAATGAEVWSYVTLPGSGTPDIDVGAGVSVTAPGVNGFAGGVAYVPGKDGYLYALNLTTGALIWDNHFGAALHLGPPESRSTPAVAGDDVVFGETKGVECVNASNGHEVWAWNDGGTAAGPGEVLSAVAVVGPPGQQVVAVTNLAGSLAVLSAATGALEYSYTTGSYSVASVAEYDGNLVASSADGFLYDFAVGGASTGAPTTAVTSPANGSTAANPDGDLTVSGTAAGGPLAAVDVAVQSGGPTGPWWDGASGTWTPGYFDNPATLAAPGATTSPWSYPLPVPAAGGTYAVQAVAVGTDGLADVGATGPAPSAARDGFSVAYLPSSPHLATVGPSTVAPGATVTVAGSGFAPGEQVAVTLAGARLGAVTAGATGTLADTALTVPGTAAFGPTSLVATGTTSGLTSTAPLDVSDQWAQADGDNLHLAFEAHDEVLADHVAPGRPQYLAEAWSYPTGAALDTSPVVVDGVAYAANEAGTVTALDVHHSVPLWTYDAASPVESTPAVAPGAGGGPGTVVFGTQAGSVVALSTATGAVLWTRATGGAVQSSPTVVGSAVYVGSDGGTLYKLNLANGRIEWQATVGVVTDSPAVDAAKQLVVVGNQAGDVTALGTGTGQVAWTAHTGNSVDADATIDAGDVFVGSVDGSVYAFNEASGAVAWTYDTGAPVTAAGAVYFSRNSTQPTYVVGSSNGDVYYLSAATGAPHGTYQGQGAVTGVSATIGFVVVVTAGGSVTGLKYNGFPAWSYQATAGFHAAPAIVDGVVYLAGDDFTVRAFTLPGQPVP